MMHIHTQAIVCGLLSHGEHGAVVRMLTPEYGLVAAYVRGARGRRMRPVLIPANLVEAELRSRTDTQLPQASVELVRSRAPILAEPLPAAAIEWVTALIASALPEQQPYPGVFGAMEGLLDAIEAAPSASGWAAALARFEQLVIAELGYGREELPFGDTLQSLDRLGEQLFRDVLTGRTRSLQDSRARLVERLRQALVRPPAAT